MAEKNNGMKFSKYYRVISPNEIDIDREEIFYRDKYNDIINYLKVMLTNHEETILQSYGNFIQPKNAILININVGTDIVDYLKLISKNYFLNFYDLNSEEIIKNHDEFFNDFIAILEEIFLINQTTKNDTVEVNDKYQSTGDSQEINKIKGILLINQEEFLKAKGKERNLLDVFMTWFNNKEKPTKKGLLLIWISNNLKEIESNSKLVFEVFDLFIKIPLLDKIERETIFRNFSEKHPKIVFDIATLVDYTVNWEVKDITRLLKVGIFKHYLNSDLNDTSNEITDVLINQIESGEFFPSISHEQEPRDFVYNDTYETKSIVNNKIGKGRSIDREVNSTAEILNQIKKERISDFMLEQLYENAVSKNYSELLLIVDKLNKREILEENDRKLLAQYAFILNDSPKMAQIHLEKAKKRIDNLRRAFGK